MVGVIGLEPITSILEECFSIQLRYTPVIFCKKCLMEFTPSNPKQIFCSNSCQNSFRQKLWRENHQKPCEDCGDMVGPESITCRKCRWSRRTTTLKDDVTVAQLREHAGGKYWWATPIRKHAQKFIPREPCRACSYDLHVEAAHILAVASFPDTAKLSEINNPDNIIPLCPNCHWEFDRGILILSPHGTLDRI